MPAASLQGDGMKIATATKVTKVCIPLFPLVDQNYSSSRLYFQFQLRIGFLGI
jgi:hypothetical protein